MYVCVQVVNELGGVTTIVGIVAKRILTIGGIGLFCSFVLRVRLLYVDIFATLICCSTTELLSVYYNGYVTIVSRSNSMMLRSRSRSRERERDTYG